MSEKQENRVSQGGEGRLRRLTEQEKAERDYVKAARERREWQDQAKRVEADLKQALDVIENFMGCIPLEVFGKPDPEDASIREDAETLLRHHGRELRQDFRQANEQAAREGDMTAKVGLNPPPLGHHSTQDAYTARVEREGNRLHNALLEIASDWSDWDEAAALKRILQIADDALKGRPDYPLGA